MSNAPSTRRVSTPSEARALVSEVIETIGRLEQTLAAETELMQAGRLNEGLDLAPQKQEQAGFYMRLLESVKANAVALARFAPDGVEALKSRHGAFAEQLRLNQTVIATIKAVSESLVRGLQTEATASRTLSVYGPRASAPTPVANRTPLALSLRL